MTLCERLKQDAPQTFEHFRNVYLRENFPYWNEEVSPSTLWFCSMDERMQTGWFIDYLENVLEYPVWETQADASSVYNYIIWAFTNQERYDKD